MRVIITETLGSLINKSSSLFRPTQEYYKENNLGILLVDTSRKDFIKIILSQLQDIPSGSDIYLDLDMHSCTCLDGWIELIGTYNIHYLINFQDVNEQHIFQHYEPTTFDDVMRDLNDLGIVHRLKDGQSICNLNDGQLVYIDSYKHAQLTSDDIFANDWINYKYTLYPTSVSYDQMTRTVRIDSNLYNDFNNLPFANVIKSILTNKNINNPKNINNQKKLNILYRSASKDDFNVVTSIIGTILDNMTIKTVSKKTDIFEATVNKFDTVNFFHNKCPCNLDAIIVNTLYETDDTNVYSVPPDNIVNIEFNSF